MKGTFITLEGIEGAGKTTQLAFIESELMKCGHDVVLTREPGGTRAGEAIREILLNEKDLRIDDRTELLLIFTARMQHVAEVIRPALAAGKTVLCDRFTDATYAYQGGGRGIPGEDIARLEQFVQNGLRPDHTILLDVPVETGLARANQRSKADRFESETAAFFEKVRQSYLAIAAREPQRVHVINAGQPIAAVQKDLVELLKRVKLC